MFKNKNEADALIQIKGRVNKLARAIAISGSAKIEVEKGASASGVQALSIGQLSSSESEACNIELLKEIIDMALGENDQVIKVIEEQLAFCRDLLRNKNVSYENELVLFSKIEHLMEKLITYYQGEKQPSSNNLIHQDQKVHPVPLQIHSAAINSGVSQVIIHPASNEQLSQFEQYMRSHPKTNQSSECTTHWPYVKGCYEALPESYVDREILLEEKQLTDAMSVLQIVSQQTGHYTHLLVGNGGVGKTCLASAYFDQARKKNLYDVMLWVDASELMIFFKTLAAMTGVTAHDNLRAKTWIEEVYQAFNRAGKLLLVIDNLISPMQYADEITKTTVN
ncbi:MAG: AAA family ATPase, partial [Gammaproteobacteria bacterium]